MFARCLVAAAAAVLAAACAPTEPVASLFDAEPGRRAWAATCADSDDWDKPGPPFRVYGDTYYVGTCGIAALLIVGPQGHTLIDTGTDKGAQVVLENIRSLGFALSDVDTILMSHEHFDHVGGMARVQAATGATILASRPAAAVLRRGTPAADDPQALSGHPPFPPVTGRIETIVPGRRIARAGRSFLPMATPGHTPGATSWQWRECEGSRCLSLVYADSLNPISADGYRFSARPALVSAFRAGISRIASVDCGILLTPHPAASGLRDRLLGTRSLIDREACRTYAGIVTERLDKRLAAEAQGG